MTCLTNVSNVLSYLQTLKGSFKTFTYHVVRYYDHTSFVLSDHLIYVSVVPSGLRSPPGRWYLTVVWDGRQTGVSG